MRILLLAHDLTNDAISWSYFWSGHNETKKSGCFKHPLDNLLSLYYFKNKRKRNNRRYNDFFKFIYLR